MPPEACCCLPQHAKQHARSLPSCLPHVCSHIAALQVFQYTRGAYIKAVPKRVPSVLQDADHTIGSIFWQLFMIALQQDPASIVLSLHERESEDSTGGCEKHNTKCALPRGVTCWQEQLHWHRPISHLSAVCLLGSSMFSLTLLSVQHRPLQGEGGHANLSSPCSVALSLHLIRCLVWLHSSWTLQGVG